MRWSSPDRTDRLWLGSGPEAYEARCSRAGPRRPPGGRGLDDRRSRRGEASRVVTRSSILELACAAGAANVTRHGLGSADGDLIASLSERVAVRELSPTRR